MSHEIIKETSNGVLWFGGNEARSDAKDLDAAKFRVGSRFEDGVHGGGGAYSFDGIDTNGTTADDLMAARRVECAVLTGSFNGRTGEVGLSIWNGRDRNDIRDADQKKVFEMTSEGIEFKVPVKGLSGGSAGVPSILQSPNGRLLLAAQDDGNFVLYKDGVPIKALFGLPEDQLW